LVADDSPICLLLQGIVLSFFPLFLLLSYCLYVVVANISGPAWFSWVGELVEEKDRGKWFAKRTFVHSTISVIFSLLAAIFLDWQKDKGTIFLGFIILFSIGIVARYISRHYLRKQYEQKLELYDGYYFSFWQFLKKAPKNNFGRFTLFRATLDFATYIASPFFAVYMLRNLEFSYVIYMVIALSQTLFSILFVKFWGRFSDRYGNYQIFKITVIIIPIYPLLWLISSNPFYLIFVPQLLGGFAWAGFNLSASNFVYDAVTPQRRGLVVSYYNLLIGVGIFLGATIGGLIALLDIQFMDIILFSFIISAIARGIVCIVMIPMFKEVRNLEKFDNSEIFKIFHINSFIRQIENVVGMNFRKVASWRK
jgi:MFS family permease